MTVQLSSGYGENLKVCLGTASQEIVGDRKISLAEIQTISKMDGTPNQLTKSDLEKAGFSSVDAARIFSELQQHFHTENGVIDLTRPKDSYTGVQLILKGDVPFEPVGAGLTVFPEASGPVAKAAPSAPPPPTAAGGGESLVSDRVVGIARDEGAKKGSKALGEIIVEGGSKRFAGAVPLVGIAIDLNSAYSDGAAAVAAGDRGDWVGWGLYSTSAGISAFGVGAEGAVVTGVAAPLAEGVQIAANGAGAVVGVAADVWTTW